MDNEQRSVDRPDDHAGGAPRKMTRILMRLTVVLTVALGVFAGVFQMLVDLKQEKDAVEINAMELVETLAPTAAKAVYNFDDRGAQQVAVGLFTQRAIGRVVLWETDNVFVDLEREVEPTLPSLGPFTSSDNVVLVTDLYAPDEGEGGTVIGRLQVTIDRSIVAPAIVDRMFLYFVIAVLKNFVLGALLIIVVFRGLARHMVRLAKTVDQWTPAHGPIEEPDPPKFLRDTELHVLGKKVARLAASASDAVQALERHNKQMDRANSELRDQSHGLSNELQERNETLRRLNRELSEIASRDSLTALYNRRYFEAEAYLLLQRSKDQGERAVVALVDIDYFKAYNDHYGHQQGDDCLCQVARALLEMFAEDEGLVARYGGEEFVILIPNVAAEDVDTLAQRIVDRVADLQIEHARSLNSRHVSISAGVACSENVGQFDLQELVGAADRALYSAKSSGRGKYVVASSELLHSAKSEKKATQQVIEAVRMRAFEPFFQPQVDARTGALVGLEVLARWRRADGSVATPGAFLPTAEKLGIDADIDAIVQEKALEQLRAWRREGMAPARLSMNLSENRLLSGELHALLRRFADVDPRRLAFELLESTFIERQSNAFAMRLDELRETGAAIEIDDFGTGHASLVSLASIAPARVKIARELVSPLGADARANKVVEAVVEVAQAFEIDLIAEGVETEEQAALLVRMNCPIQQGFYHGRPAPVADLEAALRANAAKPFQEVG